MRSRLNEGLAQAEMEYGKNMWKQKFRKKGMREEKATFTAKEWKKEVCRA